MRYFFTVGEFWRVKSTPFKGDTRNIGSDLGFSSPAIRLKVQAIGSRASWILREPDTELLYIRLSATLVVAERQILHCS
jgi:hypothetical protein